MRIYVVDDGDGSDLEASADDLRYTVQTWGGNVDAPVIVVTDTDLWRDGADVHIVGKAGTEEELAYENARKAWTNR